MRIGKFYIRGSFFLWFALLNYFDSHHVIPLAFLAAALHEAGHYIAVTTLGNDIRQITVSAAGAEMVLSHPMGYIPELVAALAGPAVNLSLAIIFAQRPWGYMFSGLNLALGCFNLLPIGTLDGGRILKCIVSLLCGPVIAGRTISIITLTILLILFILGIIFIRFANNFTLMFMVLWLFITFSGIKVYN